ncbi:MULTISPECIES: aminotransferase class I/II-fold pyridoxal phosphate-dependent enzyme [unclassified Streptomyces]|uniref:aminotransferase class I/II-fold pyridoxal phosphate-dependent enzyme n=1 Tax=unclassified Streptomyces TaxID=2593676 RepID=UPI00039C8D89|nr:MULTISPECIES: aminotransferase class I/II-fold pyridoxal phosphate-dependent enzyme [unclassified Streptomyces]MYT28260.1 aminotransferase class I/II-fold pyridoxal phosphate-dependent enzyme [Streptomyces sp. SID8354]
MRPSLFRMLEWHERIEAERQQPGARVFVSDYNGGHPFVAEYLGELADAAPHRLADVTRYSGLDEDTALRSKVAAMHRQYDGAPYTLRNVIPGGGSSALLGTFATWLALTGRRRVHYVPPVYYKLAYLFQRLGIEPVPVARRHAFQPDFDLRLPDERTVLLLTDPVWYAGRRVPLDVLETIGAWQRATGSLVFVDGTFQYMPWDGAPGEASAHLPIEQTLRMICPTKYLSIHGYRCAHLLVPAKLRAELAELHINFHGDVAVSDRLFAHRAADLMLGSSNGALVQHVRDNHSMLSASGALAAQAPIETGFFLFAQPRVPHRWFLALDAKHFELDGYPGYIRINLLNGPAIQALMATAAVPEPAADVSR